MLFRGVQLTYMDHNCSLRSVIHTHTRTRVHGQAELATVTLGYPQGGTSSSREMLNVIEIY